MLQDLPFLFGHGGVEDFDMLVRRPAKLQKAVELGAAVSVVKDLPQGGLARVSGNFIPQAGNSDEAPREHHSPRCAGFKRLLASLHIVGTKGTGNSGMRAELITSNIPAIGLPACRPCGRCRGTYPPSCPQRQTEAPMTRRGPAPVNCEWCFRRRASHTGRYVVIRHSLLRLNQTGQWVHQRGGVRA